jgi:nitroimidazol reductase NimA-like FMN-containing flavoprotein (pyridoxamine 5'-phosphate oxidase superfamily)
MQENPEPIAERMTWPDYEPPGTRALPWGWAVQRLVRSRRFWLTTSRADGTPHVMPVWGAWVGDALVFSTGRRTRKARNISANARCVITTEHADEAVIIEGVAGEVTAPAELDRAVRRDLDHRGTRRSCRTHGIRAPRHESDARSL